MTRTLLTTIFLLYSLVTFAQINMRTVDELINRADPGWTYVKQWIDSAKNKIEILPVDLNKAKDALYKTQVTTRSPMGSVIYMSGGILVDNGWIRILGSGDTRLPRSLPDWNKGKAFKEFGEPAPYFIIADDVIGGLFLLNGGGLGTDLGRFITSPQIIWIMKHLT